MATKPYRFGDDLANTCYSIECNNHQEKWIKNQIKHYLDANERPARDLSDHYYWRDWLNAHNRVRTNARLDAYVAAKDALLNQFPGSLISKPSCLQLRRDELANSYNDSLRYCYSMVTVGTTPEFHKCAIDKRELTYREELQARVDEWLKVDE